MYRPTDLSATVDTMRRTLLVRRLHIDLQHVHAACCRVPAGR